MENKAARNYVNENKKEERTYANENRLPPQEKSNNTESVAVYPKLRIWLFIIHLAVAVILTGMSILVIFKGPTTACSAFTTPETCENVNNDIYIIPCEWNHTSGFCETKPDCKDLTCLTCQSSEYVNCFWSVLNNTCLDKTLVDNNSTIEQCLFQISFNYTCEQDLSVFSSVVLRYEFSIIIFLMK